MICNTCGRQIQNEAANFCEYCGASFREQTYTAQNPEGQPFYNRPVMPGPIPAPMESMAAGAQQEGREGKPVSFLNWLGSYAILFVPIVNIIMLVIWAVGYNTSVSKKNWARATLIFMVILFVLSIAYMAFLMSTPMFRQMLEGTFDYGDYYKSLLPQ